MQEVSKKGNRMSRCPYPENFTDPLSGQTELNSLYLAWHEGFEAHKFEMANQTIKLASLVVDFENQIRKIMELKKELETKRQSFKS
jgi:CRISPR/Cas system CMR-associated protein Cmr3 (group 5 of RAMP superfamily)